MQFLLDKEKTAGKIIFICLIFLLLTLICEQLLYVKVINIEFIDRNLYSVITDKGPINILPEDILRVERSIHKSGFQGIETEQSRIYTKKGFLIYSTMDNYSVTGRKLVNEIGELSFPIWQRHDLNPNILRSSLYAIGTPPKFIPILKFIVEFQYLILTVGGLTLIILVCPFNKKNSDIYPETTLPQSHFDSFLEKEQLEDFSLCNNETSIDFQLWKSYK